MNKIILIGNLTRDPEVNYTQKGTAVAKFGLAVARTFKDKDGNKVTDFFDVEVWGKLAETVANYLTKGKKISLVGEMRREEWTDKEGQKRITWKVHAAEVEFLTPKSEDGGGRQDRRRDERHGGGEDSLVDDARDDQEAHLW